MGRDLPLFLTVLLLATAGCGDTKGSRGTTAFAGNGGSEGSAGSQGTAGSTSPATTIESALPHDCATPRWNAAEFEHVFDVGPDYDFETPSDVPWESLESSTLVRIHHREEPYHDKWVISSTGTEERPIVILGIPSDDALPIIDGDGAATRPALDFWNEPRGLLKIGGSSAPSGPAAHVTVECLDLRSARIGHSFTDAAGESVEYAENAACVYIEDGTALSVRNNVIHDCGNGIFASSGSSGVLVAGNYVFDNGNPNSIYEHNSYTEALGITFEFNHYGPLCEGCEGNNLKDRSAGTVVRYNWIEAGNRQLDLVESDHDELLGDARYHTTYVYGNVLIEPDDAGNSQILHYGGDGDEEANYRKGTLYFYANTVVSTRSGNTTLFRPSSEDETIDARNNVFAVTAAGSHLAVSAGMGTIVLDHDWLPTGWVDTHDTLTGSIESSDNVEGTDPGFVDAEAQDFHLAATSSCIGAAGALASATRSNPVSFEYVQHQSGKTRDMDEDIGAFASE